MTYAAPIKVTLRLIVFDVEEETLIFTVEVAKKLSYKRIQPDIIAIGVGYKLQPNDSITLQLNYTLILPSDKFTRFGITPKKNVKLKKGEELYQ